MPDDGGLLARRAQLRQARPGGHREKFRGLREKLRGPGWPSVVSKGES